MAGTTTLPGNLSMTDLAARITKHEQLVIEQLTGLVKDPNKVGNLGTFVDQPNQLGAVAICAAGAAQAGTKVISGTSVYISGALTTVDVYRLD